MVSLVGVMHYQWQRIPVVACQLLAASIVCSIDHCCPVAVWLVSVDCCDQLLSDYICMVIIGQSNDIFDSAVSFSATAWFKIAADLPRKRTSLLVEHKHRKN